MLVTLRVTRERFGWGPDAPELRWLADCYLDAWRDAHPLTELRVALRLALRLAPFGRALSWGRVFPGTPTGDTATAAAAWLARVGRPGPLEA
jgi:hypothetical protein